MESSFNKKEQHNVWWIGAGEYECKECRASRTGSNNKETSNTAHNVLDQKKKMLE